MVKDIRIQHSPVYDFLVSLLRLANVDHSLMFGEYYDDLLDRFKFDENIGRWLTKSLDKMLPEEKESLDSLFNAELRIFSILVFYTTVEQITNVPDLIKKLQKMTGKDLLAQHLYLYSLHSKSFPRITLEEAREVLSKEREAMAFIDRTNFSAKRKWELLQFALHPEVMLEKLLHLLTWYYENIYEKEMPRIEKSVAKYEKELEQKIRKYGNEYVSLLVNFDYSHVKTDKEIIIAVTYFGEIGYNVIFIEDQITDFYLIGHRHMEIFVERKLGILSNVHIFKALGDETRQNIIRLLAQKEWYGEELAQKMELSNSTVSYHLNILLMEGFIKLTRVDNRTYIAINAENVRRVVEEALRRMLV